MVRKNENVIMRHSLIQTGVLSADAESVYSYPVIVVVILVEYVCLV